MVGAVHVGIMAACVVLFVPMGMAGYHLSRNKMLFFSGALFITLAVGVHLTPYFPSISQFLNSSSSSIPIIASPRSCLTFLHLITWDNHGADQNRSSTVRSWDWERSSQPLACGFQKLNGADASELLNGSWVFVAGDSQARLFVLALLELVLDEKRMAEVEGDLFKRHSDYRILIEESGIKVDFVWAPYMENLTHAVEELGRDRRYPDVLILGCGLWHMLHFGNAIDYGGSLVTLKQSIGNTFPNSEDFFTVTRNVHMYWLGMPALVNSLFNTEEKKEKMTTLVWEAYDREVSSSRILYDSGGPFVLLDIALLSRKCGLNCTSDGMHYDDAVYQAALQVMLNALLVESQQKI